MPSRLARSGGSVDRHRHHQRQHLHRPWRGDRGRLARPRRRPSAQRRPGRRPRAGGGSSGGRRGPAGDTGPDQHPPPHVPEPDPGLRARGQRLPLPVAHHPVPAVGPAGRGGGVPVHLRRRGGAAPRRVHDLLGPHVRAPPAGTHRRPGAGHDRHRVPVHGQPWLHDAVRRRRRPAAARGGPGRGHDPRRLRAADRRLPRPQPRCHDPGGAGAVLPLLRLGGHHAGDGGAGREARRPAAHPPGRGPRRGRVLPRGVRVPAGGVLRAGRLGRAALMGRALRVRLGRGERAPRRGRGVRDAVPELEHDPRWRDRRRDDPARVRG